MKIINPQSKPKARKTANVMRDKNIRLIKVQADALTLDKKDEIVNRARRLLSTVKSIIPFSLDQQKRHDLVQNFVDSEYVGGSYDEPYIAVDGDMVYINGRFSLRQLAKRFQW